MPVGVRRRRHLPSLAQSWLWRAAMSGALLYSLLFWFGSYPPIQAQTTPSPHLLISEVHPAPKAVEDQVGEWLEIVNPGSEAVNLQHWSIINQGSGEYTFPVELWIPPGAYVVLASTADPAINGGVQPFYVYQSFLLANQSDRLTLRNPSGETVDRVAWGEGTEAPVTVGASLERIAPEAQAAWATAHALWSGSAGDLGSPGAAYVPPPTATPPPSPTPTLTPPPATPPRLLISEIMANPAAIGDDAGEWIELYNADSAPVNLNGWILADAGHDVAVLQGDLWLAPGSYVVVARSLDPQQNGGVAAQLLYTGLQLANEADELYLSAPWGVQVDQLHWDGAINPIVEGASLERTGFDPAATWATAFYVWSGSAGDRGSPGAPYLAAPTATPTATHTPLPAPTATATPPPDTPPRLYISEVMADPQAVGDDAGEWLELFNASTEPVNLNGWILADLGRERTQLTVDFWLAPGAYVVLARQADPAQNGGVHAAVNFANFQLANEADEALLIAPWGAVVDQVMWGSDSWKPSSGASQERTTFGAEATWLAAYAPWPSSLGDRGSPGASYVAPTAAPPTATMPPTVTPAPAEIATATPSPTALPIAWGRRALPSPLLIAQVYPQGSDQEYIVLHNWTGEAVALGGWRLGDAEIPGDREGLFLLPESAVLAPGASWIVARHAATFRGQWGRVPDAEWSNSDPAVAQLVSDPTLATRDMALANDGDEVLLLDPDMALADAVAWEGGSYAALGLTGQLSLASQSALYQAPDAPYLQVSDVRHRFALLPPDPFAIFRLPSAAPPSPVLLDGGMVAQWGSLGAASTFSNGGNTPPHLLLAAGGALGLNFLAIADHDRAPNDFVVTAQGGGPIMLPAWRWQHPEGHEAIVYSSRAATLLGWGELLEFLQHENALAQLPVEMARENPRTPLLAADAIFAPGGLAALQRAWQETQTPLLPVGNTTPPLPGSATLAPHYTGLATLGSDHAAILEALGARRGWLTSSPDLWLTLRSAEGLWMGSAVTPGNELTLQIAFGDRAGASAGLALWQNDQIVRQLDLPPVDGRWSVSLPAVPGSMLYVVATQRDGDFAITAPIYVQPTTGGKVVINEVLPAPGADHNGDGQINTGDEFIELLNVGSAPVALAGYMLGDASSAAGGHRFTLGADRLIGAGERLLLWREETGLSLNDDADFVQLMDAAGVEVDRIAWESRNAGPSLSRVPDGGEWQSQTPATPGEANQSYPPAEPPAPREPDDPPVDPTNVGDPHSPNFGQATGPPGSVALAKLRGLRTVVEFRAQVVVPPGLYPSAIYVADPAVDANGAPLAVAGIGVQVYLRAGEFLPMQEGDWILVRGEVRSFRGQMEIEISEPGQAWPYEAGAPLGPLPIALSEIGEPLEGRLVTFTGMVAGWQGDSLYLSDPAHPDAPALRITVRSSLGWRRPYVQKGELYQVTGVVSQFATASPWNDGYRVLVRYPSDLVEVDVP